jgi:hypothetical protein
MTCAYRVSLSCLHVTAAWFALVGVAGATPVVWSDLTTSFTKPAYAYPPPADQLTANVALTRGNIQGLYNAVLETGWDAAGRTSPADTEWATLLNNPDETIAATNWASLSYTTWEQSYGSLGNLAYYITSLDAVVHLITDDVYLDLRFTYWSSGGGGGFSYDRAEPPTPATAGDYNGDGAVDAADYTVWRDTLGQEVAFPGDGADGDLSGTIDEGDYTFWKQHFGESVPGAAVGALAVPEPAAAALCLVGAVIVLGYRRSRTWRLPTSAP